MDKTHKQLLSALFVEACGACLAPPPTPPCSSPAEATGAAHSQPHLCVIACEVLEGLRAVLCAL